MNYSIENSYLAKNFRIVNDKLISAEIQNKVNGETFIPDGNGAEFYIQFVNGETLSPKTMLVKNITVEKEKLVVQFEETMGFLCTLCFTISEADHYIRKQLSFVAKNEDMVDYIDLECMGLVNAKTSWSRPDMANNVGGVDGFYGALGQPIYIDSFFIGCEFPATDNNIDGSARIRYYKGEQFKQGAEFKAPATVLGVARSNDKEVLRQDFLAYIAKIETPSDFRMQYNSWYDHMLDISAENIEKSFYEIEKGLTNEGVPPLDSYVMDDGWNNYQSGFWSFNKKFPNELYDSMNLAKKFSSDFGLWLGPRGGYTFNTPKFAKRIQRAGNGHYNPKSRDICIGSKAYQKNITALFLDYMNRFDINYWKLDGFINQPCPKTDHGHKTGGFKDMYYVTECWENWIAIFEAMRAARSAQGKDLWINMTCYVNPSPWWLQWVNSMWLQNSGDVDFAKNIKGQAQVEQMLSYRDDRYFDFAQVRDQQFPFSSIYNHEPIYGNSAKVSFTDEEFDKYLYMHATRGMAFWEIYYSYNLMTPAKWHTTGNVLKWAKANHAVLRNAQLIGATPISNQVYGYSAWTEDEGIISLRNPTDRPTHYTIKMDKLIGVKDSVQNLHRYAVYDKTGVQTEDTFSCGDSFDVELKPFEVKIFQFGAQDNRYNYLENCNDFSITFTPASNGDVMSTQDVKLVVADGKAVFTVNNTTLTTAKDVLGKEVVLVREKNGVLKAYCENALLNSAYQVPEKALVDAPLQSIVSNCKVTNHALAYDDILKDLTAKKGMFSRLFGKK